MDRTAFNILGSFILMGICVWMSISALRAERKPAAPFRSPDYAESYTMGDFDRLQICKTYLLRPGESPACISTEDFQECGVNFHLSALTKEHIDGVDVYTAVFDEEYPS